MSELFKLEKEKFSEKYKEKWWTYSIQFEFIFNKLIINQITITDHPWKKKGREMITKELILKILVKRINRERLTPRTQEKSKLKKRPFCFEKSWVWWKKILISLLA